ncbi:MAG: 30S ribosomal protein S17 [candidate division Zixibacteria bacterium]|nr:30S ribosomal protein S17 [candidate division Zixibacteria bacterium]
MSEKTERNYRKMRVGIVVSDAMDKCIVIRVDRQMKHPLYKKPVKASSKLYAHDESNDAHVGDRVRVMETRPLSRLKRWRLVDVVERAK